MNYGLRLLIIALNWIFDLLYRAVQFVPPVLWFLYCCYTNFTRPIRRIARMTCVYYIAGLVIFLFQPM